MTILSSTLNAAAPGCLATIANRLYFTNNFDPVQVWDGVAATTQNAGIVGPVGVMGAPTDAGGSGTLGVHGIRYRYQNSKSGYVSNPSLPTTYTVTGGSLTWTVGSQIVISTDPKVDTISVEMTPVNSGVYYQVGVVPNVAGSVNVNAADITITQGTDVDVLWGSAQNLQVFSHYPPPVCAIIMSFKGHSWMLGDIPYNLTGVTFTNNSTAVTGTGFCTSGAWVGRIIKAGSDTTAYAIASVNSSTSITLNTVYGGTTGTYAAVVFSATPNRGYYSRPYAPEEFYPAVFARDFLQNRSDLITAAYGRKDAMYIFGLYSSERLTYNDDPSATTSFLSPIQGHRGCFNNRCVVEAEGALFAFDRQGIYMVGEVPEHLSFAIDDSLKELVDYSQYNTFHGNYDPVDRVLLFWFAPQGATSPTYAVCMEIDTGRWFFDSWFIGITSSQIVPTADGQVRLMLCDANGYSWFFGVDGSFDGVPPTSAAVVTIASYSVPTAITVNEVLPVTAPTLAGVVAYDPISSTYGIITSNTSNVLTIGAGLPTSLLVGGELWLGPIAYEYRTKWWAGAGQHWKKSPVYLQIRMFPGSQTSQLRVYIYVDFQTTPLVTTQWFTDPQLNGVAIVNNQNYITCTLAGGIDSDGFVSIPLQATYNRVWQARVTCLRPDGALRLAGLEFAILDVSQMVDKVND
jgi:hypothetical protein